MHHEVSHQVVADLLHELGYSLQANRKTEEGSSHPGRNAQFEHLNGKVKWSLSRHQPVISVDTKEKELVGDFKNGGRELRPKGQPEKVRVHDFVDPELGRATPYGIYDLGRALTEYKPYLQRSCRRQRRLAKSRAPHSRVARAIPISGAPSLASDVE